MILSEDDVKGSIPLFRSSCGGSIPTSSHQYSYIVKPCTRFDARPFIVDIHYAKKFPPITYLYGLYDENELVGVISYGVCPSDLVCRGICGYEHRKEVIQLNRLVLKYNRKNEASFLVAKSLKMLPKPAIVISYADTKQNHIGIVYQATNFLYIGLSLKMKEWRIKDSDMHSRTISQQFSLEEKKSNPDKFYQVYRDRKHRYIYFLGNKKQIKTYKDKLNYKIEKYPKRNQK